MSSGESRGRSRAADIIDLDRYMRNVRRPSRQMPVHTRERLIVDAGGLDRHPVEISSSSSGPLPADYSKRYSHDSGVSDGSYLRQRQRPNRRLVENKHRDPSRTVVSNSSVREFKTACEKALRQQQEQIARVTELCEKLVQPQIAQNIVKTTQDTSNFVENVYPDNSPRSPQKYIPNISEQTDPSTNFNHSGSIGQCQTDLRYVRNEKQNFGQNVTEVNRTKRSVSPGTSYTSSSFSSRGIRMRDRHRSDSCKTYQLIMGKLDELSHLFATRRVPASRGRSSSVLVCDKVVATDNDRHSPVVQVMHTSLNNHSKYGRRADFPPSYIPVESGHWNNASNIGSAGDVYDLDNPVQLYAQAKRLQALHAGNPRDTIQSEDKSGGKPQDIDSSLCALCRGYWRGLRRYLKQQFFGSCT